MDEYFFCSSNIFPVCNFFNLHKKVFKEKAWSQKSFSYFLSSPHVFCEIASWKSEKLIGFIFVQFVEDEAEILTFVVDPDFQKKGIGTALLKKILHKGQEKRLKKIFLEVHEENEVGKKLYQKIGFKPIGKRVKYYSQTGYRNADALTFCYFF